MNRDEARTLILERLERCFELSYGELLEREGIEDVEKRLGPSGIEYFLEISVERANEIDPTLEVIGYATEVSSRNFFPPSISACFIISPDETRKKLGNWSVPSA